MKRTQKKRIYWKDQDGNIHWDKMSLKTRLIHGIINIIGD